MQRSLARQSRLRRYRSAVVGVLAAACADGYGPRGPVVAIDLSAHAVQLSPGGAATLTAVPRNANGDAVPGRPIAWETNDPLIATVSPSGQVSGVALGATIITATVDGVSASAEASVIATEASHLAASWRMYSFDGHVLPAAYAVFYDEPVGDDIIDKVEIRLDSAKMTLNDQARYPFRQYCFTELHDEVPTFRYCWGDHGQFALGNPAGWVRFTSEYIANLFAEGTVNAAGELALVEPLWTQEPPRSTIWRRQ